MRDREQGAELNLGSNFGLTRWNEIAPRASFAYHKGKWSIDVSGNGTAWSRGKDEAQNHVKLKEQGIIYDTPSQSTKRVRNANINLSVRYAISPKDELLLYGNLSQNKSKLHNEASTNVKVLIKEAENNSNATNTQSSGIKQTDMLLHQRTHDKQFSASVNYTHKFDTEGNRNLKIMSDIARQYSYGNEQKYNYQNFDDNGKLLSEEYYGQYIPSQYTVLSMEGRYTHNTKHAGQWMVGTKYSLTMLENGLAYSDKADNDITGMDYQYYYGYSEGLAALYLKYQISKKSWDLVVGLRGEADVPGSIESKDRGNKSPFIKFKLDAQTDLFPSIYFTKRIGSQHALSFSYSRRTQRVSYRNLLPERYHQSKYEIVEGNPNIRPDYPNELSMTYTWRGKYMLGTEYTWSNNGFNALLKSTVEDGTPTYISTFTDGQRSRKLYFYLYAPINISKWWTMNFRPWGLAHTFP